MSFTRTTVKIVLITCMVGVLIETLPGESDSSSDQADTSEEDAVGIVMLSYILFARITNALKIPQFISILFKTTISLIIRLYDLTLVLLSPLTFPFSLLHMPNILSQEAISLTWLPLYQFIGGTLVVGFLIGVMAKMLAF